MLPPSPSPSLQHGTPAQHKCCLVSSLIEPQPAGWVGAELATAVWPKPLPPFVLLKTLLSMVLNGLKLLFIL